MPPCLINQTVSRIQLSKLPENLFYANLTLSYSNQLQKTKIVTFPHITNLYNTNFGINIIRFLASLTNEHFFT